MNIPFLKKGAESGSFERTEISAGDIERIDAIRGWLLEKKSEQWAEKELKRLGYNEYHIDFLMRIATDRKEPRLPESLVRRKEERAMQKKRVGYEIATIAACAVLLYAFFWLGGSIDFSRIFDAFFGAFGALGGAV